MSPFDLGKVSMAKLSLGRLCPQRKEVHILWNVAKKALGTSIGTICNVDIGEGEVCSF